MGLAFELLNAKNHEREAHIIAQAGRFGAVTLATNIAGRGVDILLGGNPIDPEEAKAVREAGGLAVIGTERHESRRIDNQLRGRAGRQGDQGESRFYISLEDQLIRRFGGDTLQFRDTMKQWAGMEEDEIIEDSMVSRAIEYSQEKVEKQNFEVRKHLLEYDDVMNQHRKVIYSYRHDALAGGESIYDFVRDMIIAAVEDIFEKAAPERSLSQEQADSILAIISRATQIEKSVFDQKGFSAKNSDMFLSDIINFLLEQYQLSHDQDASETRKNAEKWLVLETIDQAWKQHMLNLDHLKEGISLRSWGQKNPLIEYKKEAFAMFQDMMHEVRWEIIMRIFSLKLERFDSTEIERKRENELEKLKLSSSASEYEESSEPSVRTEPRVGRNDACACGSGKKYKKCCGS